MITMIFKLLCVIAVVTNVFSINLQQVMMRKLATAATVFGFSSTLLVDANAASAAEKAPVQVYGLKKDRLLPCKTQSNCISSSSIKSLDKYGRPWSFTNSPDQEYDEIVKLIEADPYLKLVEQNKEKNYIHAEAKSAVPPTGVDDVEFLINPIDKLITYRSNSRDLVMVGMSAVGDGGSNINRLEAIKRKLNVQEMRISDDAEDYMKSMKKIEFLQQIKMNSQPNEINFIDNSVPDDANTAAPPPTTTATTTVASSKETTTTDTTDTTDTTAK